MDNVGIKAIQAKTGVITLELKGYLLHSKYDPIKEAKRIVEKEIESNHLHIIFGYGAGYIISELIEKLGSNEKIIVIDPLYDQLMKQDILKLDCLIIKEINLAEIKKNISAKLFNFDRKIKVICSPNYNNLLPEDYVKVLNLIKDLQNSSFVNENTVRIFATNWQENIIKNLAFVCEDETVNALKNKYKAPVVIASGGPSLTKQLPLLKKIANRVIILAAGSTINSLLREGIEPDYVVTIDGSELNYKHFENIEINKTKLIYMLESYYKIQEVFPNKRFVFLDIFNKRTQQYIKGHYNKELPLILGGASVSSFALTIASEITTGPIAIIGQDLAYSGDFTHANNNKESKKIDYNSIESSILVEIDGYYGGKVKSTYEYLPMKESFENILPLLRENSRIFNCTEGGAKINGMLQISFSHFYENYVKKSETLIGTEYNNNNILRNRKKYYDLLKSELNEYQKLKKEYKLALNILEIVKLKKEFSVNNLSKLEDIDSRIKKFINNVILQKIADPIVLDIMKKYEPKLNESINESFNRVYQQNKAIYEGLMNVTEQSEAFIKEAMDKYC